MRRIVSLAVLASLGLVPQATAATPVAGRAARSVVTVQTASEQGTAFVFGTPDHLLTAAHVVGTNRVVTVLTASGRRVTGHVVAVDRPDDLALIAAPVGLPPIPAHAKPVVAGEPVLTIGSPLGLAGSVVSGIVSAVRRHGALIQTDLPLSPGDSGSPLLDDRGRVMGVNESRVTGGAAIGFATAIADAHRLRPVTKAGRATPWALLAGGAAAVIMVASSSLLAVSLGRRRGRVKVKLRPAVAPPHYEPEPRVRLKQRDE